LFKGLGKAVQVRKLFACRVLLARVFIYSGVAENNACALFACPYFGALKASK